MRKGIRSVLAVALAVAASTTATSAAPPSASAQAAPSVGEAAIEPGPGERTGRLRGDDRFATAVQVSRHAFPDGAPVVHVARGDVYVDALAGGVLRDGPILLVRTSGAVPQVVLDEVARLDPARVIALGGTAAVSDQVLRDVAGDRATSRLRGPDRYATAAAISRHAFPDGARRVTLVTSDAEALAAGNIDEPVLLVSPEWGSLPTAVVDEVLRLRPSELRMPVYDPAVEDLVRRDQRLHEAGLTYVDSLFVDSVEEAAARFAFEAHGAVDLPVIHLARLDDPVDALAGGALSSGPVLLVPPCGATSTTRFTLDVLDPTRVIALGGPAAVCDQALEAYGRHARAPFPAPGLAGTVATPDLAPVSTPDVFSFVVAASGDGDRVLVEQSWYRGDDFGEHWFVWDLRTGETTTIEAPTGRDWTGTSPVFALSPDGATVWSSAIDYGTLADWEIWEHEVATGATRLLRSGHQYALKGRTIEQWTFDGGVQETRVIGLVSGVDWAYRSDDPWAVDGFEVDRASPDGEWLLVGRFGEFGGPYEEHRLVRPDGTVTPLLSPASSPCGPVTRRVESITEDADRLLLDVFRYERDSLDGSCRFGGEEVRETFLFDVETQRLVPVATLDGVGVQGSGTLSADGTQLTFHPYAPFVDDAPHFHLDLAEDGPLMDGAPPTDGDRGAGYVTSVADVLAGNPVWRALGWTTARPHVYGDFVGNVLVTFHTVHDGPSRVRVTPPA